MKPRPEGKRRGRAFILIFLLLLIFAAVGFRSVQLQIIQGQKLNQFARKQHQKSLPLLPKRGTIYSRNLKELSVTLEVDSLYAMPEKMEKPKEVAERLARLVSLDQKELEQKLMNGKSFVWIKRWLSEEAASAVRGSPLEGLDFAKEGKRFYPYGSLAGQVLGFAGLDGQGLEGIELFYEKELQGSPGALLAERDARGRTMFPQGIKMVGGARGRDLVLTLDETLQHIAEKELAQGVAKSQAQGGTAIIMDPKSGEILALANYPEFNPNLFEKYPSARWRNRAITDLFEPGSTLKVFTVAAALEEGVFRPEDVIYTEKGKFRLGTKIIHDVHPYGWLSVRDVVKVSSNIGAAKIGLALGRDLQYSYMKKFGLFELTGIDIKGEGSGLNQALENWSRLTVATVSFGQGISVTPIQLANAYASLANGGLLMRPYLLKKILDKDGQVIKENRPQILRQVMGSETAKVIREMLTSATGAEGTGKQAEVLGYQVAGKTGTAQKPSDGGRGYAQGKYMASFVGWVPAHDPRLLILVVIDEPKGVKYGGVVAAPVFRNVASQALAYLRVEPDHVVELKLKPKLVAHGSGPEAESLSPPPSFSEEENGEMVMPNFHRLTMRQALKLAQAKRMELKAQGSGVAVSQDPEAGEPLRAGQIPVVRFSPPSRPN